MSEFTKAFEDGTHFAKYLSSGACSNCRECFDGWDGGPKDFVEAIEYGEYTGDVCFSRSQCDICGTSLAGSRHPAHCFDGDELVHLMVCVDCIMHMANGDEPENWRR